MIVDLLPSQKIPDTMQECLQAHLPYTELTSFDIFQGLYYLSNQGMLAHKLSGTYFEPQDLPEISSKLGQYIFVLDAQKNKNIVNQTNPKEIMQQNAKKMQKVLADYDRKITQMLSSLSRSLLDKVNFDLELQVSNKSSNTFIPHSSAMSNWDGIQPEYNNQSNLNEQSLINKSFRQPSDQFNNHSFSERHTKSFSHNKKPIIIDSPVVVH